jgi:hypothetical protein
VPGSLGTPVSIGLLNRLLGEAIFGIEILVALTVIAVALFGSKALSERAFRLLRFDGNRPESNRVITRCITRPSSFAPLG